MQAVLAVLLALTPFAVLAQATPAGLPTPLPPGLRVERAAVVLDLRPLATPAPTVVETVLVVTNPTGTRLSWTLDALAAPGGAAELLIDRTPVPAVSLGPQAGPPLWRVAETTPEPGGSDLLPLTLAETARGLRWEFDVPPGRHEIRLRLALAPGEAGAARQAVYSLAPARLWPGLTQIDLAVEHPDGWAVATSLPLRAESPARLVGRFASVPGDAFAVTAVPPKRRPGPALWIVLGAVAVVLGAAVAWLRLARARTV